MAIGINQDLYKNTYSSGYEDYDYGIDFSTNTGQNPQQGITPSYGAGNMSNLYNQGMSILSNSTNAGVQNFMGGAGGMALGAVGLGLTAYSMYSGAKSQAEANAAQMAQIDIGIADIKSTIPDIHQDQKMDIFKQEYETNTAYSTFADSLGVEYDKFTDNVRNASKRSGAVATGAQEVAENKMESAVEQKSDELGAQLSFDAFVKSYETERKYATTYGQISRKIRDLEYQKGILGQHDEWTENIFG